MLPVYLVHWNAPDWCRSACESIWASVGVDVAVTVINNGGRLDLPSETRIIETGRNLGYAGGANVGLREWLAGDEEWCVVGAHDLLVESDCFDRMLATDSDRFGILSAAGAGARGRFTHSGDTIDEFEWVSGTCMMVRRTCITDVGIFDEHVGSYSEDVDLCRRALAAGWSVGAVRAARATDIGSAASAVVRARLGGSNAFYVAVKHRRWAEVAGMSLREPVTALGHLLKAIVKNRRVHLQLAWAHLVVVPLGLAKAVCVRRVRSK